MTAVSETGHAKNVANFSELVSFVSAFGAAYNPSKTSIQLTALQALTAASQNALKAVNTAMPAYSIAVAEREKAFMPLSKLCTRIINALKASDASTQLQDDAKTLLRKLQGQRATPKKTEAEKQAMLAEGKTVKEISTSQMSYDSRLENFDKLISLLKGIAQYTPNEADLKADALSAHFAILKIKNAAVISAAIPLSNARLSRNNVLYNDNTGLVDVAQDIKAYIKSVFGASAPQYKQISKLTFKAVKL